LGISSVKTSFLTYIYRYLKAYFKTFLTQTDNQTDNRFLVVANFTPMQVNFNLRNPQKEKGTNRLSPINVVIRYNGWRFVYSSGLKVRPDEWNEKKQHFKGTTTVTQKNNALDNLVNAINETYTNLKNANDQTEPTTSELKQALDITFNRVKDQTEKEEKYLLRWQTKRDKNDSKKTVVEYSGFMATCTDYRKNNVYYKTGRFFSKNTLRNFNSTQKALKDFAEAKSANKRGLLLSEIDINFYNNFVSYCKKDRKLSQNTIGTYIKIIKTVIGDADERGIKVDASYKTERFKTLSNETDAIYLTETELAELASIDLTNNKRLERVRDLFLVGCRTGLRFSDFSTLQPEDFDTGYIRKKTQKQQNVVLIPIHPDVARIREMYETDNRLPGAVSNQKFNKYIKEVCRLVPSLQKLVSVTEGDITRKVNKWQLVSTHTARRTFATNCYLLGAPTRTIMNVTGHKKEHIFFKYIRMTPTDDSNILSRYLQGTPGLMKVV
jgi:integrase